MAVPSGESKKDESYPVARLDDFLVVGAVESWVTVAGLALLAGAGFLLLYFCLNICLIFSVISWRLAALLEIFFCPFVRVFLFFDGSSDSNNTLKLSKQIPFSANSRGPASSLLGPKGSG